MPTFDYKFACMQEKNALIGQLKYLFLVGKFSRKREWVRYRKKEQSIRMSPDS